MKTILALDAGTANVKAILVDQQANILGRSSVPLAIQFPGRVEQSVDSWLVWNLTGGKRFVTDFSNASRTQLLNIGQGAWDPELLAFFGEVSGLGAAFAAGLGCAFWSSTDEIGRVLASHDPFHPRMEEGERSRLVHDWNGAVASVKALALVRWPASTNPNIPLSQPDANESSLAPC